jgi:cytoskeleton protein RodZ
MKTVGKQLQEARLAKEWSPELAARETKIKIERLRDLEADDYSNFSSPTYARGFVRTYARSLNLDEYKLLRQLDNKLPEDDNASFANDTGVPYMPEPSQVSTSYRLGTGVYVAMGAGSLVLLLIAFVLFQSYRAGYFAQALPAAAPAPVTNAAPAVPDAEAVSRALPADSNAAPVALPVDVTANPAADAGTNAAPAAVPVAPVATPAMADVTTNGVPAAPVVAAAPAPAPITPLDTKTPPRALPVDLNALSAAPAATAVSPVAIVTPVTNAPPVTVAAVVPAPTPAPAPVYKPPPSLSARGSNARPAPVVAVDSAPPVAAPAVVPLAATPIATVAVNPATTSLAAAAPTTADNTAPSEVTGSFAPSSTAPPDPAPALTGETPAASSAGKRLILRASRDSYIRVVSLDNPNGQQVRYSSVLRQGQSISFNDRKYSINVGVPSAVDISLDGINYGPHSDHSEPDTFTVESHQP